VNVEKFLRLFLGHVLNFALGYFFYNIDRFVLPLEICSIFLVHFRGAQIVVFAVQFSLFFLIFLLHSCVAKKEGTHHKNSKHCSEVT